MNNFFDQIQEDKQKNLKAIEEKAEEYKAMAAEIASLKAQVNDLQTDITNLQGTISGLNTTLEAIKPADLEKITQESTKVFEPLEKAADTVARKVKAAGNEAAENLKRTGEKTLGQIAAESAFLAIVYIALTLIVLWLVGFFDMKDDIAYNREHINAIHWNQTTGTTEGARTYSPWEMRDFNTAWDNENRYLLNKAAEDAKNQK